MKDKNPTPTVARYRRRGIHPAFKPAAGVESDSPSTPPLALRTYDAQSPSVV